MTVTTKMNELTEHIEAIKNDGDHDMSNIEVGNQWNQGDVRIVRLADSFDFEKHCTPIRGFNGQVAPGNTVGSRHTFDSLEGVSAYTLNDGNDLDGPVCHLDVARDLNHPEHGNCCGLPPGNYAFPGQRVYALELKRVMD